MGIEIRRRFIEAGLEGVTVVVIGDVETRMDDEEVDEYRRVGRELVEQGVIDPARLDAAIDHLVRTNEAGTYSGLAVMFVAVGTVPVLAPDPTE
jgi:hypothetical protein